MKRPIFKKSDLYNCKQLSYFSITESETLCSSAVIPSLRTFTFVSRFFKLKDHDDHLIQMKKHQQAIFHESTQQPTVPSASAVQ